MKIYFTTFLILLTVFSLQAQDETKGKSKKVIYGIVAGYSNMVDTYINKGYGQESNSETGFYIGVNADFALTKKWHFQPSILFSSVSGNEVSSTNRHFISVPMMFKYYALKKFNFQFGQQINVVFDSYGRDVFGYDLSVGLGYDISKRFFLEARYNYELTNRRQFVNEFVDYKEKYNSLFIGVGFRF